MTTRKQPHPLAHQFRQVLLSWTRIDLGIRTCLEVLKVRQNGPRRSGTLSPRAAVLYQRDDPNRNPGILLDYLNDHPEEVAGLDEQTVLAAVEAVRIEGGWFAIPKKHFQK